MRLENERRHFKPYVEFLIHKLMIFLYAMLVIKLRGSGSPLCYVQIACLFIILLPWFYIKKHIVLKNPSHTRIPLIIKETSPEY